MRIGIKLWRCRGLRNRFLFLDEWNGKKGIAIRLSRWAVAIFWRSSRRRRRMI